MNGLRHLLTLREAELEPPHGGPNGDPDYHDQPDVLTRTRQSVGHYRRVETLAGTCTYVWVAE